MNIADFLLEHGRSDRLAVITQDDQYTYQQLHEALARMVFALKQLGVRNGDPVGILGQNSFFWIAAYLAILKIGSIAVPFSNMMRPQEVKANKEFVGCKVIFIDHWSFQKYKGILAEGDRVISEDVFQSAPPLVEDPSPVQVEEGADAALMFTSGTTAQPRAVRITHKNIQSNTDSIIEYLGLSDTDRMMVILPFFYCFGTSLLHTHLRSGASLVVCNTFAYPETVLDRMESTACTGLAGTPTIFQMFMRNTTFPQRKLTSLRKIQQAGGKLYNAILSELIASHPDVQLYVMYGQTEATARLSYLPPALLPQKLGSIGRGIPGVNLRVLNENGMDVSPGEIGEIVAQGDSISPGYWEDPVATREKFTKDFLRTGDLATVDEEGFIFIVDRISDFIKSYGHRVSSQEIEACILQVEEVVAAAVIGIPNELAGESIKAFVVLRSGSSLTPDQILGHCRKNLARYMLPDTIVFVDGLPLNAQGKVVKPELRKMFSEPK